MSELKEGIKAADRLKAPELLQEKVPAFSDVFQGIASVPDENFKTHHGVRYFVSGASKIRTPAEDKAYAQHLREAWAKTGSMNAQQIEEHIKDVLKRPPSTGVHFPDLKVPFFGRKALNRIVFGLLYIHTGVQAPSRDPNPFGIYKETKFTASDGEVKSETVSELRKARPGEPVKQSAETLRFEMWPDDFNHWLTTREGEPFVSLKRHIPSLNEADEIAEKVIDKYLENKDKIESAIQELQDTYPVTETELDAFCNKHKITLYFELGKDGYE